mmetsp:Transcript_3693/g.13018  ORF Transcript_3693/g.13018 Transcript_3693/m.13018 type:complete len:97 (-) Transcript_3693:92-382(-)
MCPKCSRRYATSHRRAGHPSIPLTRMRGDSPIPLFRASSNEILGIAFEMVVPCVPKVLHSFMKTPFTAVRDVCMLTVSACVKCVVYPKHMIRFDAN